MSHATAFRRALLDAIESPAVHSFTALAAVAAPIFTEAQRDLDLKRALRGATITFHEFCQRLRGNYGGASPWGPEWGIEAVDALADAWGAIALSAAWCGPSTVAVLADGGLARLFAPLPDGHPDFAQYRRFGMTVPAERLRHMLANGLALPSNTGELLGAEGLARLADSVAWTPGHPSLSLAPSCLAALLLAALPPTAEPAEAESLLAALCAANGLSTPAHFGVYFGDLSDADDSLRADRLQEWLLDRLPAMATIPPMASGLVAMEHVTEGEKAWAALLATAERAALAVSVRA